MHTGHGSIAVKKNREDWTAAVHDGVLEPHEVGIGDGDAKVAPRYNNILYSGGRGLVELGEPVQAVATTLPKDSDARRSGADAEMCADREPALAGPARHSAREAADGSNHQPGTVALTNAYSGAYFICMRTTVDLDEELVRSALSETHARTKTEVIEMGLRALLEREARRRLRAMEGKLPDLATVRRRRP
jgi:Arc/MetJ family transcription regulator